MIKYIIRRLLQTIPVLIGVSILVFSLMHLIPGDAAQIMAGEAASEETVEQLREKLGLNEPLYRTIFHLYFKRSARGSWLFCPKWSCGDGRDSSKVLGDRRTRLLCNRTSCISLAWLQESFLQYATTHLLMYRS